MTSEKIDAAFQTLMLQAEIAGLIHDIGKFSNAFIQGVIGGNSENGQEKFDHSLEFLHARHGNATECAPILEEILKRELPETWFKTPESQIRLKGLGDLLRFHHGRGLSKHLKWKQGNPVPLVLALIMIADSIDSSSSKGGARFSPEEPDRESRLRDDDFFQSRSSLYIATPLGEQQAAIDLDGVASAAADFQKELAAILKDYADWDLDRLKEGRKQILSLMEDRLSNFLAETRLPTNDVSLWQHSYSTASIFKAMLARHLLLEDYVADENGNLAHYRERLAFLGVQWSEDALLSRAVRPKDILGRRARLLKIKSLIKDRVESDYALGNEIYADRDGIYFLIPSPAEDARIASTLDPLLDDMESTLNSTALFPGDLDYRILCKEVGIQVLGLSDLLEGKGEVLRAGPRRPGWVSLWEKLGTGKEICSRCGLRPAELVEVTSGSEGDEEKTCTFCSSLAREGGEIKGMSRPKDRKRLLGVEGRHELMTSETDRLVAGDKENARVALVQGIFNLQPFLSGEAFSYILSRMPSDYSKDPGAGDNSREIGSWPQIQSAIHETWEEIRSGKASMESIHTLQQLFSDTFLGTERDGRVPPGPSEEKLRAYIEDLVLKSPFPPGTDECQKIVLYALRQHPAPSRIARIWETTESFCRGAVAWCESNKVRHFPVSIDPGSFQILLPADRSWEFLQGMNQAYQHMAGRVRHLLPFHLSACVFYYKAPLYVGIDAARRFADLHAAATAPRQWELNGKEKGDGCWVLTWIDHAGREVTWQIPERLPNARPDRFFTWFAVEGEAHPVPVSDIQNGQRAWIWPSTFDYEVLDTTTRRYDIRIDAENTGRPHLFFRHGGPRPYPLSAINQWQRLLPTLDACEPTQLNRLIALVGRLHMEWGEGDLDVLKAQIADYLELCMGNKGTVLMDAAVSGSLLDIFEWNHFIGK